MVADEQEKFVEAKESRSPWFDLAELAITMGTAGLGVLIGGFVEEKLAGVLAERAAKAVAESVEHGFKEVAETTAKKAIDGAAEAREDKLEQEAESGALWRAMLPAAAPVAAGVDFAALARRFALAGGHIRNAALRAAFVAADEGTIISPAHLERAARLELEAMGKIAA